MTRLADVLTTSKVPTRVDDPESEKLISVRLHGRGAVRRLVSDGKAPKSFIGNRASAGQFVFSRIWARRGAMALIPPELDGVVVTNEFPLFDVDSDRLDAGYLNRYVQTDRFLADLERVSAGASGQNRVKEAAFLGLNIRLPPLPEQRRIAAILDHADALRAKRRQVLIRLNALPQSLFTEMFASRDFESMRAGILMPKMRNGLSPATSGTHSAQVLTLSSVTQGPFDPSAVKPGMFAVDPPDDKRITRRDFLMCRGNGNKALVGVGTYSNEDRADLVFPDTIIAGTVDTALVTMPFLEAAWKRRDVRTQIESLARTTNGTYKVNQQALASVLVSVPPLDLQRAFADRVEKINMQRVGVQQALVADNDLIASLQSRAFRGEL